MFSSVTPHPWRGRYARIPGHSTAFHVRLIDGDWWPIVRWTTDDETAHCPMVGGDEPLALARAVNAGKLQLGGESGGSFHINEYGQVLVPGHRGDGTIALVGEWEGALEFWNNLEGEGTFDLTDDEELAPGDAWELPYLGIPHNLERGKRTLFLGWGRETLTSGAGPRAHRRPPHAPSIRPYSLRRDLWWARTHESAGGPVAGRTLEASLCWPTGPSTLVPQGLVRFAGPAIR